MNQPVGPHGRDVLAIEVAAILWGAIFKHHQVDRSAQRVRATRTAGIPLSPHFKQTRGGQGAPGQAKRRTSKRKASNGAAEVVEPSAQKIDGYRLDVTLRTGGTMTLTVDVNPISLRGADRTFFYDIVDKMTDYNEVGAAGSLDGGPETEQHLEQT